MKSEFGVALPTFASPGAGLFRTPGFKAPDARYCIELARRVEELGFGSVFVPDHLMIGRDDAVLEGWTVLSAVAAATSRVGLGLIQQSNLFRHPSVVAKAAATLDRLSGGRFTLFYSMGNKREETEAYGLEFPSEDRRAGDMREAIELISTLWSGEEAITREAPPYRLKGARCEPRPKRPPPIWFAGTHPLTLDTLARHGSGWCTPPVTLEELETRLARVVEALVRHGRSFAEIEVALETQILVAPSMDALRRELSRLVSLDPDGTSSGRPPLASAEISDFLEGRTEAVPREIADKWLIGTPELIRGRLAEYRRRGVNHFILWFMDLPHGAGLELFEETVMRDSRTSREAK